MGRVAGVQGVCVCVGGGGVAISTEYERQGIVRVLAGGAGPGSGMQRLRELRQSTGVGMQTCYLAITCKGSGVVPFVPGLASS